LPTSFSGSSVLGAAFASSPTLHGGQETTLFTIITNLAHFGMTVFGPNNGFANRRRVHASPMRKADLGHNARL
jgi:multimeric flavodoxin WrbA